MRSPALDSVTAAAILGVALLTPARPQGQPKDEKLTEPSANRPVAEMLADTYLDARIAAMATQAADPAELVKEMRDNRPSHVRTQDSLRILSDAFAKRLEGWMEESILEIHRTVNLDHPGAIALDWLRDRPEAVLPGAAHDARAQALVSFKKTFADARTVAVNTEWKAIEQFVRNFSIPAETVERADSGRDVLDQAHEQLCDEIAAARFEMPLFEENDEKLTAQLKRSLARGLSALRAQRNLVRQSAAEGALVATIRESLEAQVQAAQTSYEIFPSVRRLTDDRAQSLQLARLTGAVTSASACASISAEQISRIIVEDLVAHSDPGRSHALTAKAISPEANQQMVRRFLKANGESVTASPEIDALLNGPLRDKMDGALQNCLAELLKRSRARIAAEQLRVSFSTLAEGTLDEATLQWFRANRPVVADEDLFRRLELLSAVREPSLLRETADLARSAVRRAFEEGIRALDSQLAAADSQRPLVEELRARGSGRQDILSEATSVLRQAWRRNNRTRYAGLFKATEMRLSDIVDNEFTKSPADNTQTIISAKRLGSATRSTPVEPTPSPAEPGTTLEVAVESAELPYDSKRTKPDSRLKIAIKAEQPHDNSERTEPDVGRSPTERLKRIRSRLDELAREGSLDRLLSTLEGLLGLDGEETVLRADRGEASSEIGRAGGESGSGSVGGSSARSAAAGGNSGGGSSAAGGIGAGGGTPDGSEGGSGSGGSGAASAAAGGDSGSGSGAAGGSADRSGAGRGSLARGSGGRGSGDGPAPVGWGGVLGIGVRRQNASACAAESVRISDLERELARLRRECN